MVARGEGMGELVQKVKGKKFFFILPPFKGISIISNSLQNPHGIGQQARIISFMVQFNYLFHEKKSDSNKCTNLPQVSHKKNVIGSEKFSLLYTL